MPESSTVAEIEQIYLDAWKLGLKAIAIYRDNCKRSQPLSTSLAKAKADGKSDVATGIQLPTQALLEKGLTADEVLVAMKDPSEMVKLKQRLSVVTRRKLEDERAAITHKFSISGHEGYLTVGLFEDGQPGELFCTMSKEGSTISGLMDAFATMVSLSLQYGVPLKALVDKFSHTRFEPSGFTKNPEIPIAKSITDYIFRWLASKFLSQEEKQAVGVVLREPAPVAQADSSPTSVRPAAKESEGGSLLTFVNSTDAPSCHECGSIMVPNGACFKCENCGGTSGCS